MTKEPFKFSHRGPVHEYGDAVKHLPRGEVVARGREVPQEHNLVLLHIERRELRQLQNVIEFEMDPSHRDAFPEQGNTGCPT